MKEAFKMLFKFDLKGLFITPTHNTVIQAGRALVIGGIAFIGDAGLLYIMALVGVHYSIGAIAGFIAGVAINYTLSSWIVFTERNKKGKSYEVVMYVIIGVIGLLMTEGILFCMIEKLHAHLMLAKVVATIIVFIWNFTARKLILYRKGR